jgi:cellulose synthase/poly-beta-1,6-N-acetylglucosamine synthase-like glycosyltransferase
MLMSSWPGWHQVWLGYAVFAAGVWLVTSWAIGYGLRRRKVLHADGGAVLDRGAPRLSVVVAAKDEEANIEGCVRSLLEQDYPDLQIIVADDRSEDATPHILARLAAETAGRLQVVRVTELPPGWFGKNNAVRQGLRKATGSYFCFTDADCRLTSRSSLTVAMAHTLQEQADFVSINPTLLMPTAWERIVQPVCSAILLAWFPQHRVNKRRRRAAYANGQFMLLRREAYDALGGHESVRTQVNEDIHLARLAKERGLRLRIIDSEDLYTTRMYATPRETWRGWSRIFYGSIGSPLRIAGTMAFLIVAVLGVWAGFLGSLLLLATRDFEATASAKALCIAWGLVLLLMHAAMVRVYRPFRLGIGWSLTFPLGAAAATAIMGAAFLKAIGASSITWRGTTYRGERVVSANQDADTPTSTIE